MFAVQDDFPLLARRIDGRPLIYLDSAATSLTPRSVLQAQYDFSTTIAANVRRSRHALGEEASFAFASARRRIARFIGADPACVVFTAGATEALNLVAHGLALTPDQTVLVPSIAHHSNLVPWMCAARVRLFRCEPGEPLAPAQLEAEVLRHRPTLVTLNYVSNVTGVVHDVPALCARLRALGVMSVVDASQAVAHFPLDVDQLGADFVAFSGHKMAGPFGIGVLWGSREQLERLRPLVLGGGAVRSVSSEGYVLAELPDRLEAGTPNITAAIGLAAAADYLEQLGWPSIRAHDAELAAQLDQELEATRGIAPLGGRPAAHTVPLRSFTVDAEALGAERLSAMLSDGHNIMVRAGFHCAHPLFQQERAGAAVRVSAYLYNTKPELIAFGEAVRRLLARFTGS